MAHIRVESLVLDYPVLSAMVVSKGGGQHAPRSAIGALQSTAQTKVSHVRALQSLSFSVKSGQRLGIVGRNGSGKSTLLRVLAGVYDPTHGMVEVSGRIAPMFAMGLGVRRDGTGRQNIRLRGLLHGLTSDEIENRINDIIEFSELGEFIDMPVRSYSAGMAMRLSFAMGTTFSPEVILMDEWIGAGDQNFQQKARKRMEDLVEQAGITVIASHNKALLQRVCDLGLWLDRGRLGAFGPLDEVLEAKEEAERNSSKKAALSAPDLIGRDKRK